MCLDVRFGPEVGAGALARLWLFLGRIIRPDPKSFFPAMLRLDAEGIALALAWVAVAAALVLIGARLRSLTLLEQDAQV